MLRDAALIARKDLRLELRSRVALGQILPFALLVLLLFAFALDADRAVLNATTSGLYWIAVLFSALLAVQRSFATEAVDGNRDALLLAGLEPAGIFLGKAAAVAAQLLVLELVLVGGVALFYDTPVRGWPLLVTTCVTATAGLVAAGTIYGALAGGLRVRETLVPLLFLPVVAPVLLGATRAFDAALGGDRGTDGWAWCSLLGMFAVIYVVLGMAAFGSLLEDS